MHIVNPKATIKLIEQRGTANEAIEEKNYNTEKYTQPIKRQ